MEPHMTRRILAIIFVMTLSFSLTSLVVAFDNNANFMDQQNRSKVSVITLLVTLPSL
jgi:hypothetical protein